MLFSVIVANYNNGQYLPELIQSILNQTYTNWELIIVDDCSIESPVKYIAKYLTDKRIQYLVHDENLGVAATFKTAIDNASGEIIGMLGADDALVITAIEIMVNEHYQYPDVSMINSECYWCDEKLNILNKLEFYKPLQAGQTLIRNLTIGSFATFKRIFYNKTEGFDPAFKRAVDHDIYLKLDEVGALRFIYKPLYLYRKNAIGISQNSNGAKAAQFSLIAKYNAYKRRLGSDKENLTKKEIIDIRINWYLREIHEERLNGDIRKCNKLIINAIREVPVIIFYKAFILHIFRNNIC